MTPRELDSSELNLLETVIEEFNDRCRKGEQPQPEEYAERYPSLAFEILETLPALKKLHSLTPSTHSKQKKPLPIQIPQRIAEYRIVRELGRGGMGVVYQAVQESLGREVALKVLPHSSLFDQTATERFKREAHIAAQLHHTNIVPVFGTGQSEGIAYFAMQYIDGQSLDRVIRRLREIQQSQTDVDELALDNSGSDAVARRLLEGKLAIGDSSSITERIHPETANGNTNQEQTSVLISGPSGSTIVASGYDYCVAKIGIQAASALAHAHAHGVLHRDVKPSNLILDKQGTVWVTDFGLAKQENQESLTSAGDLVGTLRFMPPERFHGVADVRSDIYSLGLTIYELLTLRPSFEEANRPEMIRRIFDSEPPAPRKIRPSIARDLETIVRKAIAKDPQQRYATAAALGADLERYLTGRPVAARPVGPIERAVRWCRRNQLVASLAAALFLVLVAGLIAVTWQWRRAEFGLQLAVQMQRRAEESLTEANRQRDLAERNFLRARQAVDDYLTSISESDLLDAPTLEPVRVELLERAKGFYESFYRDRRDDPRLKAEMAASYIRLSQVLHDIDAEWLNVLEQGLAILEDLAASGAPFDDFRSWREGVYNTRSGLLRTDEHERLTPIVERAINVFEQLVRDYPQIPGFRSDLAGIQQIRGMLLLEKQNYDKALAAFVSAKRLRDELIEQHPDNTKFQYGLGESLAMIGVVQLAQKKYEQSLESTIKARDILASLARDNPSATRLADILAAVHQWVAAAQIQNGNPFAALASQQEAIRIRDRLAREYPYVSNYQLNLVQSLRILARSLHKAGQIPPARDAYEKIITLLEQRLIDYPQKTELLDPLLYVCLEYARVLQQSRDFEPAARIAKIAVQTLDKTESPRSELVHQAHMQLGSILYDMGNAATALPQFQTAVEAARQNRDSRPLTLAYTLYQLGRAQQRTGDPHSARKSYEESIDIRVDLKSPADRNLAMTRYRLATALQELGQVDEAEAKYRDALQDFQSFCAESDPQCIYTRNRLVDMLRQAEHWDRAEEILAQDRAFRTSKFQVCFGGPWNVVVQSLDDAQPPSETAREFSAEALDLVWGNAPPMPDLPAPTFRLTATAEIPLNPGRYELCVQCGDRLDVSLDGNAHSLTSQNRKTHSIPLLAKGEPIHATIEYQHRTGQPTLRLWIRPAEPMPTPD